MLPSVPPKIFEQNPRFHVLYENLTSSKLNSDGSSKVSTTDDARQRELDSARIELAKKQLIIDGLQRVSQHAEDLPIELLQAIELIAAYLDGQLAGVDVELLEGNFDLFKDNVDAIASAMSKDLSEVITPLLRMINASETQDKQNLVDIVRRRQLALSHARQNLLDSRERIMALACEVLDAHTACLDIGIRTLEQTIHGSVARGTRAKAEHLSTVAEGVSGKSQIAAYQARADLFTPELRHALQNYASHLESSITRIKRREVVAEDELVAYEEAGDGMREIGRRFAEVKAEIEKVQAELRRLDSRP